MASLIIGNAGSILSAGGVVLVGHSGPKIQGDSPPWLERADGRVERQRSSLSPLVRIPQQPPYAAKIPNDTSRCPTELLL